MPDILAVLRTDVSEVNRISWRNYCISRGVSEEGPYQLVPQGEGRYHIYSNGREFGDFSWDTLKDYLKKLLPVYKPLSDYG